MHRFRSVMSKSGGCDRGEVFVETLRARCFASRTNAVLASLFQSTHTLRLGASDLELSWRETQAHG